MRRVLTPLALAVALLPLAACSSSPENLAADLERALEAGDADAAMALARLDGAPAMLHFLFLDKANDCAEEATTCRATIAPLDEKFTQQLQQMQAQGLEAAATPEGLVVVEIVEPDGKGTMRMPYAKVDGKYRIVSQRYTAAELAKMRATSNESLLEEMLAQGIYDPASGERRTDWKDAATPLPAGGGEPGEAFARQVAALAAAADANDPDAAVASGDGFAKMVVGPTGFRGEPVPLETRKRKLRAQNTRFLRDLRIEGGYVKGDEAVLLFEARDGIGWIQRGAMLITRDENGWGKAGTNTVSYPAN